MAKFKLSSKLAVGATKTKSFLTAQKLFASDSAVAVTFCWSSPVTTTAAWLRGASAQA